MDIVTLLLIAVAIVVVVLALRLLKGAFKIFTSVIAIIFVLVALLAIIAYKDARTINGLMGEDKFFLYEENETYLTGAVVDAKAAIKSYDGLPSGVVALSEDFLSSYEPPEGKESLHIVFKEGFFANESVIDIQGYQLTKEEFSALMRSDDPLWLFASWQAAREDVPEEYVDEAIEDAVSRVGMAPDDFRAALFLASLQQFMKGEEKTFLLHKLKADEISIYPELVTIRLVKVMPSRFFEDVLSRAIVITPAEDE
jgi:hypothetical protein